MVGQSPNGGDGGRIPDRLPVLWREIQFARLAVLHKGMCAPIP
jgi:hypothetical protein